MSPRTHELRATDRLAVPNSLAFAGIPTVEVEAVDIHRHAAEKFHGMLRDYGERENSRVRDLVDLTILLGHDLLVPELTAAAVRSVWLERNNTEPPDRLRLPESWPDRYQRLAANHGMGMPPYDTAVAMVSQLWLVMFPRA